MALRDEKTSLGRKKEGDTVLQLWGGYFLKKDGAVGQLPKAAWRHGREKTVWFSLPRAGPCPWLKLAYLDASRIHPFSLLCQKERRKMRENGRSSKRLWFGYQVRLLLPRSTSHLGLSYFINGFLPWKEAERVGLDMIQFIQLNLKSFIYWCLKMVRLGNHVWASDENMS